MDDKKTTTLLKSIKNGNNDKITYTYDELGNIETIKKGSTQTNKYYYDELNQLIREDNKILNKTITYDALGNPLTYDGNTYTWQNGRQLAQITNTTKNKTIEYKYNDSGIRTQKKVNGVTTTYYLEGTKVIYEKTGNNIIYYTYDENDKLLGLNYNNAQYYYIKNG